MNLTLDKILNIVFFFANKNQRGGNLSPEEYSTMLQVANLKVLRRKCGLPEQDGNPNKQEFEKNASNTDSLSNLKVWMGRPGTMPLELDSDGIALIPPDYFYHSSASYKQSVNINCKPEIRIRPVDVKTDAQWDECISNPLTHPTYKYPACNYQDGILRFSPIDMKFIDYVYIKNPATPFYDYYFNAEGTIVYMPPNTTHELATGEEYRDGTNTGTVSSISVELEWKDQERLEIAMVILQSIGVNIRESALVQYSEKVIQGGV